MPGHVGQLATYPARPRVIAGVGGSSGNLQALSWAIEEAASASRPLVVVHGCPADSALAAPGAGVRMALLELVDPPFARAVTAARRRLGGDRVSVVVRAEPPADLLVGVATPMDLVVIGPPTRAGWLERASTTQAVVRRAPCPVVVVRPSSVPDRAPFRGHVVVGVDGSAAARAACEFGFAYAAEHRRPLTAVTVLSAGDAGTAAEAAALALLAEEVEPWQHKYPDVAARTAVLAGQPLPGLLRAAGGALMLVVGHSGTGLTRRLLGSVSHGAVDRASCSVAVVGDDRGGREVSR